MKAVVRGSARQRDRCFAWEPSSVGISRACADRPARLIVIYSQSECGRSIFSIFDALADRRRYEYMAGADATSQRARPANAPPQAILQTVSGLALTVLGEILGSSLTGKLLAGALGALLGTFLTAQGSHHKRRIVAVVLLLAVLDAVRALGSWLTRSSRAHSARRSSQTVAFADWLPRRPMLTLAAGLAGFAAGTGITAVAHGLKTSPPLMTTAVRMPDVIGQNPSKATAILAADGLKAAIRDETALNATDRNVLAQSPSPGKGVVRGSTVVLTVAESSRTPSVEAASRAVVPKVVGLPAQLAVTRLADFHTTFVRIVSTAAGSQVLEQTPRAGTHALIGSVVTLAISSHARVALVTVPGIADLPVKNAEAKLKASRLTPGGDIVREPSRTVPSGAVISSTPAAGSSVKEGSTVTLTVSTGIVPTRRVPTRRVPTTPVPTTPVPTTPIPSSNVPTGTVPPGAPPPTMVIVPKVAGLRPGEADATLRASHLVGNEKENHEPSGTVPSGEVISSSPAAGSSVKEGSIVTLTVSIGVPPPS